MNEENSLIDLTNPPFTLKVGDKELQVKKAGIVQLEQFLMRRDEVNKKTEISDESKALEVAAYAIFLVANASDNTITETWIRDNVGGIVNPIPVLIKLGFIDPVKVEFLNKLQESLISSKSLQP